MNDKFLYQNRPVLRAEFDEELYTKLFHKENALTVFWETQRKRSSFWISAIILFLALAACVQKIISTDFHLEDEIAGVTIYEVNFALREEPEDWLIEIESGNYTPEPTSVTSHNNYDVDMVSFDDALEMLSFEFIIPSYIPEGFNLKSEMFATDISSPLHRDSLYLMWAKDDSHRFSGVLTLSEYRERSYGTSIKVSPGKWEKIEISGITAILINGNFPHVPNTPYEYDAGGLVRVYWDDKAGASLLWKIDGIRYSLSTMSPEISSKDLISMAESMINN